MNFDRVWMRPTVVQKSHTVVQYSTLQLESSLKKKICTAVHGLAYVLLPTLGPRGSSRGTFGATCRARRTGIGKLKQDRVGNRRLKYSC